MRICSIVLCCVALMFPVAAFGAGLTRANQALSVDKVWNPQPQEEDLTLPMPCGGQMVLRAVAVSAKGLLYDKKVSMGVHGSEEPGRDMYERAYEAHISGPFTGKDLPPEWRQKLKARDDLYYYFLGKYEVSQWQWKAVMEGIGSAGTGGTCPTGPITEELARPVTGITWLQMQDFLHKYTTWLLQQHKNALPVFADNDKDMAFLRLPTETEWEFAARGGLNVPEEHRNQEDFHPLGDKSNKGDFGIFQSAEKKYDAPQAMGSRNPNPLGFYDMAGNAMELVQSPFQFSVPDLQGDVSIRRLHGSVGGLVAKGGSYGSTEEEILPGRRVEVALFNEGGPVKSRELGFRLALTGINTPASASRLRRLETESQSFSPVQEQSPKPSPAPAADSDSAVKINPSGKLLPELEKILLATATPAVKGNLEQYRALITDYESAIERQRDEALLTTIRSVLYQIESLRSMALRFVMLNNLIKDKKDMSKELKQKTYAQMDEYKNMLGNATNNYKDELTKLAKISADSVERRTRELAQAYRGQDTHSQRMRQNLDNFQKHLAQVRTKGTGSLSKDQVWKDVIYAEALKIIQSR